MRISDSLPGREDKLKKILEIEQAKTAPLERHEFIVQVFNKTAVFPVDEIIDDILPPLAKGIEELIKIVQATPGATHLIQARIWAGWKQGR